MDFWPVRPQTLLLLLSSQFVACSQDHVALRTLVIPQKNVPPPSVPEAGDAAAGAAATLDAGGPNPTFVGCTLAVGADPAWYDIGETADFGGYVVLRNKLSDQCLQLTGCPVLEDGRPEGLTYEQAPCTHDHCQVFGLDDRGDAWMNLRSLVSGFCVDGENEDGEGGAIDSGCISRRAWQFRCAGNDAWNIVNFEFDSKLAAAGDGGDDNGVVHTLQAGGDEQLWYVEHRATVFEAVLPTSEADPGVLWRYTTSEVPGEWLEPDFDDSSWDEGRGGFGDGIDPSAPMRTLWTEGEIWLRNTFMLDQVPGALDVFSHHDFTTEVYINGVLAAGLPQWSDGYRVVPVKDAAVDALVVGRNHIAVHCHNDDFGVQFIDLGLGQVSWR